MTINFNQVSAITSLGAGLVGGWASRYSQKLDFRVSNATYMAGRRVAVANNAMLDQQAAIENRLRAGQNRILAAQARTENVLRKIGNKRILMRTSLEHEQATENFLRTQEAANQGNLEEQLRAAEARGSYAAASALSGTLGSTVETMEGTLRLKQSRDAEYRERQQGYATYDQLKQLAGIVPAGVSQLDTGTSVPMLDHGVTFSQAKTLGPEQLVRPRATGNFFTDLMSWSLRNPDGFRQVGDTLSSWFTSRKTVPDYLGAEY